MKAKTFEVRDRGTFIPVLAVKLEPACEADRYLLGRAGFGTRPEQQARYIQLAPISGGGGQSACDPYDWTTRSMRHAHQHIIELFDELESGAVVDVEFILAETTAPKKSEREETGEGIEP